MAEEMKQEEKLPIYQKRRLDEVKKVDRISIKAINQGSRVRAEKGSESQWTDFKNDLIARGQIQSIAVSEYEEPFDGFNYFLLAGGRRLKALKEIGETEINATIYPSDLDGLEIKCIELTENVERLDLTEPEKIAARAGIFRLWQQLYGKKTSTAPGAEGISIRDAARMLKIDHSVLVRDIQLDELFRTVPGLAEKVKTRKEALQLIKKAEKNIEHREKVAEIEEKEKLTTSDQVKEMIANNYILQPFLDGVKGVNNDTIDLIVFDPDYPIEREEGSPVHTSQVANVKLGSYTEVSKKDFESLAPIWLAECYRVMKPLSWIIVWFGYEYFGAYQVWLKAAGFDVNWYHGKWFKGGGHTRNPYRYLGHSVEPFFYARKGLTQLQAPHPDLFHHSPVHPDKRINAYEKPTKLMQAIFETFIPIGSRVMSPFAGSGNDGLAATNHSCTWIGYDVSEDQKAGFKVRVFEGEPKNYK